MILTVTLNPSVDVNYQHDSFTIDTVNRVEDVSKTAGGKGLNVARVLRQLNRDTAASGYLGGSLGDFIRSEVEAMGIQDWFVSVAGETRNCIAIIHDGKQTELLESGPTISAEEAADFLSVFKQRVQDVELVTISGSLPKGLSAEFYVQLLEIAREYGKPVLLDANGAIMQTVLAQPVKPLLIKPNEQECADILGVAAVDKQTVIQAMTGEGAFQNIPYVVVTRGKESAIVKVDETLYEVHAPNIQAVNPVGSGDAVIAGFAAGLSQGFEGAQLLTYGLAMGVLNALEEKTGHINPDKVEEMVGQMSVREI